jgi:hypothetical protein
MSNREEGMNAATLSGGPADRSMTWGLRAARTMGLASFGLAAAFVLAPGRITRTFGLEGKENLIRAFGAQEVLAGMGSLSLDATPAMWSRAAGDVVYIGTLATGLRGADEGRRRNVAIGLAALAGFLAIDTLIAARLGSERSRGKSEPRDYSDRGFPNGRSRTARNRGVRRKEPVPAQ